MNIRKNNPHWKRPTDIPDLRPLDKGRLQYRRFKPPSDAPSEMLCVVCQIAFPIPWERELDFEYRPVQSKDGRIWVPEGLPVFCPHCGSRQHLKVRTTPFGGYFKYFGDEAFRENIKGYFPYCYALVAIYPEYVDELYAEFLSLKKEFLPTRHPADWVLHVKDLRNERSRSALKHGLSIKDAMCFVRRIASWMGSKNGKLVSTSYFSLTKAEFGRGHQLRNAAEFQSYVRELLFNAVWVILTDQSTRSGLTPYYTFESDVRIFKSPFVPEWIERAARGHRFSLLFQYICRGHDVLLPTVAEKGADFRLELADVLAFSTMHSIHRWAINREALINMEEFGRVHYGAFSGKRFGTLTSTGIPWEYFFGSFRP